MLLQNFIMVLDANLFAKKRFPKSISFRKIIFSLFLDGFLPNFFHDFGLYSFCRKALS